MKQMLGSVMLACFIATVSLAENYIDWNAAEGMYNDSRNWVGGKVPDEGEIGQFTANQNNISSYVVRFPQGGYVEKGVGTIVRQLGEGHSVIFDTTGTYWLKDAGANANNWNTLLFGTGAGGWPHIWNLESVPNDRAAMKFENGILSFAQRASGSRLALRSGNLNVYDPDPNKPSAASLLLFKSNYSGDNNQIVLQDGSALRAGAVEVYGGSGSRTCAFLVEGGNHEFRGLSLRGGGRLSMTNDAILDVTGTTLVGWDKEHQWGALSLAGTSRMTSGRFSVSGVDRGVKNIPGLEMTNSASLSVSGILDVGGTAQEGARSFSQIRLSGDSHLTVGSYLNLGNAGNSDVDILLNERAQLESTRDMSQRDIFQIGKGPGSSTRIQVTDDAEMVMNSDLTLSNGSDANSELVISGNARVVNMGGVCYIGRRLRSKGTLRIQDHGKFRSDSNVGIYLSGSNGQYDDHRAAEANIILEDGSLEVPNGAICLSGTNSCLALKGGTSLIHRIEVGADANTGTTPVLNRLEVSKGIHHVGDRIDVGSKNGNTRMRVSGGILTAGSLLTIGKENTGDGSADFILSGGGVQMVPAANAGDVTPAKVLIAKDSSSTATASLLGGILETDQLEGGSGTAHLVADGGRVTFLNSGIGSLKNFDSAVLGEKGLTLDVPVDVSAEVEQSFTDEESKKGVVKKVGRGTLSIAANSDHAQTVLSGGTVTSSLTDFNFGQEMVITNGALLDLRGDAVSMIAQHLVLGDAETAARIALDPDDLIHVAGNEGVAIEEASIVFSQPEQIGSHPIIRTAVAPTAEQISKLKIENPQPKFVYAFSIRQNGESFDVVLTISASELADAEWSGATGSAWDAAGNWTPNAIPVEEQVALFPLDARQHTVQVSAGAVAGALSFAGDYTLTGSLLKLRGGCTTINGAVQLQQPLEVSGTVPLHVKDTSSLTLENTVSAVDATVSKDGTGKLAIQGENRDFNGKWVFGDGEVSIRNQRALGSKNLSAESVKLTAGTLSYDGAVGELGMIQRGLSIDTGNDSTYAILNAATDVIFGGNFKTSSGNLIKTGPGMLVLNFPDGTSPLGNGLRETPNNGGEIQLPDNGCSPTTALSSLGACNVLDGTLRLQGTGSGRSIVNQQQSTLVGANWSRCTAAAVLDLENLTFKQGGPRKALCIGYKLPAGVPQPIFRMNNSEAFCNTLQFGPAGSAQSYPVFAITNAVLTAEWGVQFGDTTGKVHPTARLGQGAMVVACHPNGNNGAGLFVERDVDALITDHAVLAARSTKGNAGTGLNYGSSAKGVFRFERGGTLETYKFTSKNYNATSDSHVDLIFNGGVLRMTFGGISAMAAAEYQGLTTEGDGLEIQIPEGISHTFTFPIRGEGPVVKTGKGELTFGKGQTLVSGGSTISSGIETGGHSGQTTISEGTLRIASGGIVSSAKVAISSGAALALDTAAEETVEIASLSGSGTVSSGSLTGGMECGIPEVGAQKLDFKDVTIVPPFIVNFNTSASAETLRGMEVPVATFSGTSVMNCDQWKARSLPENLTATFEARGNTIYAMIAPRGGTVVILK